VRVAGAPVADVGALPEMLQNLAAREDSSWLLGEQCEQVVFPRRQRYRLTVGHNLMLDDVDAEAAQSAYRHFSLTVELTPPQDRPYATEELYFRKWLGDVIVGADLETEDAIGLRVARRQHDDRHRALSTQTSTDLGSRKHR
jgi:hypothetical protein